MNKISLSEDDDEFFEFTFEEDYDMFTFIYTAKERGTDDPIELKTELGSREAMAIMEAVMSHLLAESGLTREEFITRYIDRNKFRGAYEQ